MNWCWYILTIWADTYYQEYYWDGFYSKLELLNDNYTLTLLILVNLHTIKIKSGHKMK